MSVVATVPSLRMNGDRYEIKRIGEKVYCDCPAASFGKTGTICKHRKIYEVAQSIADQCTHVGHTSNVACVQCIVNILATLAAEVEKTKRRKR